MIKFMQNNFNVLPQMKLEFRLNKHCEKDISTIV